MRRTLLALPAVVLTLGLTVAVAAADSPHTRTVIGHPGDLAVGTFDHQVHGRSAFIATPGGGSVTVYGAYRGLKAGRSYFTVIYGNGRCDPVQAFPVGPFVADSHGRATLAATVALPAAVDVGQSGSVSVRRGDDATDIDGDGITGPGDVVAIPGRPSVGLIECDRNPDTLNLN